MCNTISLKKKTFTLLIYGRRPIVLLICPPRLAKRGAKPLWCGGWRFFLFFLCGAESEMQILLEKKERTAS